MTPKVTVTFVVGLTSLMTPKGDGVIRGCRDLPFDHKGQLDLWPWPWPRLWPQKVTGSLEVSVAYFLTPKVNLTLTVTYFLNPKVKLTFDLDLDLCYDPKRSRGH